MLFGLERGIRAVFSLLGRLADNAVVTLYGHSILSDLIVAATIAALIIAFALILWKTPRQRDLWHVPAFEEDAADNKNRLGAPSAEEKLASATI